MIRPSRVHFALAGGPAMPARSVIFSTRHYFLDHQVHNGEGSVEAIFFPSARIFPSLTHLLVEDDIPRDAYVLPTWIELNKHYAFPPGSYPNNTIEVLLSSSLKRCGLVSLTCLM